MDRAWLNDMAKRAKRNRINPTDVLKQFRPLAVGVDPKVAGLRTGKLKRRREIVEACLFCYGLSCRMERPVWLIDHEGADYDVVVAWENNRDNYFAPTQLKEVIQKRVNPEASVQSVIDGLAKYPVSTGLTVAIRV